MSAERRRACALLTSLVLLVALESGVAIPQMCLMDKRMGLSLAYSVNSTGHPQLEARLEQPSNSPTWQVNIDLGTAQCETSSSLTVVKLTLNGSPIKTERPAPPPGYSFLPGLGYYKRPEKALNWTAARDFCNSEGTSLSVPKTQDEINQLISRFSLNATDSENVNCVWIGASDLAEKGKFITLTGAPLKNRTAVVWKDGQPSGHVNDRCVNYCVGGGLYDDPCSLKFAFLCS